MLLALLLLAAVPAPVLGDPALAGALGALKPEPGAWVEYAVRTRGQPDVRVRVSVLPPALPDGWFWLEVVSAGSEGLPSAVKLRARGDPGDRRNLDRMLLYVAGQAPIEVPLDQLPDSPAPAPGQRRVVSGAPERVRVKAGVFANARPVRAGEVRLWRDGSVPLWGLVKARTPRQTVELIGYGHTGAHSTFPQGNGSESMK